MVSDIPDQPPEWVSVAVVTRIPKDVPLFSPLIMSTNQQLFRQTHKVLQVKVVDGNRSTKNDIKFTITGGPEHLFGINEDTWLVYSKDSADTRNGAFIFEITASNWGDRAFYINRGHGCH